MPLMPVRAYQSDTGIEISIQNHLVIDTLDSCNLILLNPRLYYSSSQRNYIAKLACLLKKSKYESIKEKRKARKKCILIQRLCFKIKELFYMGLYTDVITIFN